MAAIIIKSGTTLIPGATVSGSFSYFSGDTTHDLGPSSLTGFYQGIDAPSGGYAVYGLGGPSGVTVRVAANDTELNTILIQDGATGTTLSQNTAWANSTGLVLINTGTLIVTTFRILTQAGTVLDTQSANQINYQH